MLGLFCKNNVRDPRVWMLQDEDVYNRFEMLRLQVDETISSYYEKIYEISNEVVWLGEPISNEKIVSKMLKSLPEKYNTRISSTEEATDVTIMMIGDLVGKLVTFKMNLDE